MTIINYTTVLGVILTLLIQVVTGEYCDNGDYCSFDEYCCGSTCCRNSYGYSFWNLWYFWFVMFIIMMSCCGMCSYAKRRQYYGQQHNQIIIPAGQGRTTNITATAYPIGVRQPPPGPAVHHQHALPPQAYQSPPPYSEVTSKPDLYPAYQGPPAAMPYPTQQYAYPPQFQQQPMYPPGPLPAQSPPPPTNAGQPPAYTHMLTPTAPSDDS